MSDSDENDPLGTGGGMDVLARIGRSELEDFMGKVLGNYRIVGFLAEGGMGRVFRAERIDGSFDRDVAIKVSTVSGLNRELMDRFLREQAVLATLNHPNISQLFDAGSTDEGRPYLVMELIDGEPIDAYVKRRNLDSDALVDLMIDIVGAVAFAHARLIVHRDIKPSNVMVDSEGRPKLLDFGIAKPLDPGERTITEALPMSPRSASPEQLLGKPITIASDIYQLGLLFAHILTGKPIERGQSLRDAIEHATSGRSLTLDAAMRRQVPRELALIIEQCLRPEVSERYADANALQNDLVAFRDGFPVNASGESVAYRLRKFVSRNKAVVATAVVATVSLLAGASWHTWQLAEARDAALAEESRAEREAAEALRARNAAEAVAEFLAGMLAAAQPAVVDKDVKVRDVLATASDTLEESLADQPLVQTRLLGVIGDTYQGLGLYREAEGQHLRRLEIYDRMQLLDHPDRIEALEDLAWLKAVQGERDEAIRMFREVVASRRSSLGEDHEDTLGTVLNLSNVYVDQNDWSNAESLARSAVALSRRRYGDEHAMTMRAVSQLATVSWRSGRLEEALEQYEEAYAIGVRVMGETHPDVLTTLSNLLGVKSRLGLKEEANEGRRRLLELQREAYGSDHPHVVTTMVNLAVSLPATEENFAERESLIREALAIQIAQSGEEHPMVVSIENALGNIYHQHERHIQAEEVHRRNLPRTRRVYGNDNQWTLHSMVSLARTLCELSKFSEAMGLFEESSKRAPKVLGDNHPHVAIFSKARTACIEKRDAVRE